MLKFTYEELVALFQTADVISSNHHVDAREYDLGNHNFLLLKDEIGLPVFLIESKKVELIKFSDLLLSSFKFNKRVVSRSASEDLICFQIGPTKNENIEIFVRFIEFLIPVLQTRNGESIDVIYDSLRRWKAFWNTGKIESLGEQELQGLWGELFQLSEVLCNASNSLGVSCWTGCLGEPHDFEFPSSSLEVKTTLIRRLPKISISSSLQLQANFNKKLYLKLLILDKNDQGSSILSLIDHIENKLNDYEQVELWSRLSRLGYRLEHESLYAEYKFLIRSVICYEIKEGFPRICPDSMIGGMDSRISKLNYEILLEDLDKFTVSQIDF